MTDITTFRLRITGSVQGVGFREWSVQQAADRKLDGWVRNRSDGSVEMLISGPDRTIQDMLGGRLDAVICDDPVALYYVNKKADTAGKLNISFKTEEKEYYGFTVRQGRKDLVEKLNKGIKEVKASGVEAQLLKKWMGVSK